MLRDLQTYLKERQQASLQEIVQQFHTDADALRGMLNQLIRKGRVQKTEGAKCTHCRDCAPESVEFYEWIN
ncbi:MAG TPA: FeoC-like transcriptional regulator [Synechococcales cyanobacterium M55_K2018_004]|nr:FeoC-like transcriptional regulator [Synechococcales cyanobacterium M55_K2018_004]